MCDCESKCQTQTIPYVAHESAMARAERASKRLWAVILVLIVMLVGTNAAWLWYESQWETVETVTTQEVWQEAETGENTFIGGDMYGQTESQNNADD